MNSLRGAIMANRVDVAVRLFPGVIAAPLVLGTVAGSGGRLCVDLILHLYGNLTGALLCPTCVWQGSMQASLRQPGEGRSLL